MQKIMFNDRFGLTQAVLEGRKTQTRRIITPQPYYDENVGMIWKGHMSGRGSSDYGEPQTSYRNFAHHSKYKVGEIISIAQRYEQVYAGMIIDFAMHNYHLSREDSAEKFRKKYEQTKGWKNKMFVKSKLMPSRIKITNVRVQQLQDITDDECLLEGIEKEERIDGECNYIFFDAERELYIRERTPREAYARLIDAISGKGTWYSNPYVFAYDFELI